MFTLKKGAMPIPEVTSGCIMGDLEVLYIFAPDEKNKSEKGKFLKKNIGWGQKTWRDLSAAGKRQML